MLQEFVQQIEETARNVIEEVHTLLPGKILSFQLDSSTATVQPLGNYITLDGKSLSYPILTKVPVIFPFCPSAEVGILFPIKEGDSCLILVSEIELENWRSGVESEASLRFDLTNAIILPGLQRDTIPFIAKAIENDAVIFVASGTEVSLSKKGINVIYNDANILISDTEIEVTFGSTKLRVSKKGVEITGDLKVTGTIFHTETIKLVEKGE